MSMSAQFITIWFVACVTCKYWHETLKLRPSLLCRNFKFYISIKTQHIHIIIRINSGLILDLQSLGQTAPVIIRLNLFKQQSILTFTDKPYRGRRANLAKDTPVSRRKKNQMKERQLDVSNLCCENSRRYSPTCWRQNTVAQMNTVRFSKGTLSVRFTVCGDTA